MSLQALKNYLQKKQVTHLGELALYFRQDPEMIRCKMRHFISKGQVELIEKPMGCGTRCTLCKPSQAEVYCWVK